MFINAILPDAESENQLGVKWHTYMSPDDFL